MDFDSSSKFISSLAKFLQSLCNGYVEFDNGVEVIGHIYLSVDTGKKIDYILNEKVCKTDENSVTFISNSFHAQPAEKPKPPSKGVKNDNENQTDTVETQRDDDEIIIMDEPESTNVGTVPSRDSSSQQNPSSQSFTHHSNSASKRPYSFPSNQKSFKYRRTGPRSISNPSGVEGNGDSLHSDSNSATGFLSGQGTGEATLSPPTEADMTHLSQVFPQSFNNSSTSHQNLPDDKRDVKPVLDSDMNVVNVKQEYDMSAEGQGEEDENYYESEDHIGQYSDGSGNQFYRGQRSEFDPSGTMGAADIYQGGSGMPGDGGAMGDHSGANGALEYPAWEVKQESIDSEREMYSHVSSCTLNNLNRYGKQSRSSIRLNMDAKNTHCAWCSAANCKNSRNKRPDLSFFGFPSDPQTCEQWLVHSRRTDLKGKTAKQLTRNYFLCEEHFEECCFSQTAKHRKRLVKGSLPTIFIVPNPRSKLGSSCQAPKEEVFDSFSFKSPPPPSPPRDDKASTSSAVGQEWDQVEQAPK